MRLGYRSRELLSLVLGVSSLGADRRARLVILALGLLLPVKKRLGPLRNRLVRVRLQAFGARFPFTVRDRADYVILREVLVEESYRLRGAGVPETIVDLGANVGASALYFRLRYPEARIVALEPSPPNFEQLRENVGSLPGVEVLCRAVADREGSMPFHVSSHGLASSLEAPEGESEVTNVQVSTLDGLLGELSIEGVDVLKIDVEGAEWGVLRSFSGLDRLQTVVGEVHLDMIDASREEFFALFDGFDVSSEREHLPDIPGADRWRFEAVRRTAPAQP